MTTFTRIVMSTASALFMAGTAQASTVSIAETITSNLTRGATESAAARLFAERSGVSIGNAGTTVDFLASTVGIGVRTAGVSDFDANNAETLGAGTYDSFLIHFDSDVSSGTGSASGAFTFAGQIVAIILSNGANGNSSQGLLNASDAIFGNAGTAYDNHIGRRAEGNDFTNGTNDSFTLSSMFTLEYDLTTNATHVDNIRVITEVSPVPLPAGAFLLLTGLGGLAAHRRRKTA